MAPQTLDSRVRLWLTPNGDLTDNGEGAKTADNAGEASWYDRYRLIVAAGDVGAAFAAVFASHALRFGFQGSFRAEHWLVPLAIALTWVAALQVVDSRSKRVVGMGLEEYRRVLEASLFAFGAVAVVSYLVRAQPSRSYFVLALPVGVVLLLSWRWLARSVLSNARRHGRFLTPAVIVGSRRAVARAVHELTRRPEGGIRPVAVCLPRSAKSLEDFPAELERVDRGHVPEIVEARHLGAVVIDRCDATRRPRVGRPCRRSSGPSSRVRASHCGARDPAR